MAAVLSSNLKVITLEQREADTLARVLTGLCAMRALPRVLDELHEALSGCRYPCPRPAGFLDPAVSASDDTALWCPYGCGRRAADSHDVVEHVRTECPRTEVSITPSAGAGARADTSEGQPRA